MSDLRLLKRRLTLMLNVGRGTGAHSALLGCGSQKFGGCEKSGMSLAWWPGPPSACLVSGQEKILMVSHDAPLSGP